jgi:hypothetical protein
MKLLTKSKFKLALSCPTKLYYSTNQNEYENQSIDDQFLQALAEGGYQVGELAKYLFCDDPVNAGITIDDFDYEQSVQKTEEKRTGQVNAVIAEAAFRFDSCFVRVHLMTENNDEINIYEVKAKSWDAETGFLKTPTQGPNKGTLFSILTG